MLLFQDMSNSDRAKCPPPALTTCWRQSNKWIPGNSLHVREAARKNRICSPGVGQPTKSAANKPDSLFGIMIDRW